MLSKDILKDYLFQDRLRNSLNCSPTYLWIEPLLAIFHCVRESYYVRKYLKTLRMLEYYQNNQSGSIIKKIMSLYYSVRHQQLSNKYHIYIQPNTVGKGVYIPHFAGGIYLNCFKMGDNCTVSSGVIVGNKATQDNRATIGDNVELTVGCKVIGKVNIGDNVIVCPNSVVIKDVPDYSIVSGVPAIIIKRK